MNLRTLIADLQELEQRVGSDATVVVGETNGTFVSRIQANARRSNTVMGAEDDESWTVIIQGYMVLR